MQPVQPILVVDLFPPLLDGLLALLDSLSEEDWARPTACAGWAVKDVADHLLGGDLGMLSRRRDGYSLDVGDLSGWENLVQFINTWNRDWVAATRRLSPRVTRELLAWAGPQVSALFASLDPFALGGPVSWAGPDPAPVWLDLAREYTERWHHQQHIRDAVGRPGFTDARFMSPVLDAFARALPHTFRHVAALEGTTVTLTVTGVAGGAWTLRREGAAWTLYTGRPATPDAETVLDQDTAWRLFTKGIPVTLALDRVTLRGDPALARGIFETVSIIA